MAVPSKIVRGLPSLADIAFLLPAGLLFGGLEGAHTLLADGDTGWHIRAGEWMLAHAAVPRQDLFSFTRPDQAWCAWEWGAEAVMALLARHGGLAAVVLAAVLLLSLTFTLLYRLLRARCGNVLIAIAVTAAAVAGSSIHWLARPHLATLLLTVVYLRILESGRRLWLLPLFMVLWTNLHPGFVFGLLLVGIWAIGSARAERVRYGMTFAACVTATFVNPYLWHLHVHILRYLTADSWQFDHISEFLSPSFHPPRALYFEAMLALALAAVPKHLGRRRFHYALLTLAAGHMALVSARNIPLFMIAAAPAAAVALTEWLEGMPQSKFVSAFKRLAAEAGAIERQADIPLASVAGGLVLAAALSIPQTSPRWRAEFDPRVFPAGAVEVLRGGPHASRVFTSDQWGDYLIYRLYPEFRVFVDGRSDFYGSEVEQICQNVFQVHSDWQERLARYRVDTLLLPVDSPAAGALQESRRWHVVYADASAVIFRTGQVAGSGGQVAAVEQPENQQVTLRSERK